jgi:Tfp pilus assembly protein PilF
MSLVADLLSKISSKKIGGDIPPTLARTVFDSQKKTTQRRKLVIAGGVAAFLGAAGLLSVYYLDMLAGSSLMTHSTKKNLEIPKGGDTGQNGQSPAPPQEKKALPAIAQPESVKQSPPAVATDGHSGRNRASLSDNLDRSTPGTGASKPGAAVSGNDSSNPAKEIVAKHRAEKDELLYAARSHEAAREYDEALDLYKKALDLDRQNHVLLNNIAGILLAKGAFKEAAGYARTSLDVNGNYVPSLINLGIASVRLGKAEEGKAALFKAVLLQPSNTQALMNLAVLLEGRADYEEARHYYSRLAAAKDSQGYIGIARVAEKQGKQEEARKAYREILATDSLSGEIKKLATERLAILEGG